MVGLNERIKFSIEYKIENRECTILLTPSLFGKQLTDKPLEFKNSYSGDNYNEQLLRAGTELRAYRLLNNDPSWLRSILYENISPRNPKFNERRILTIYCNTREFLKDLIKKQYKFVNSLWK